MKATFDNTVSILVKAYLNDTLRHGDDCACAVGNLICHANGYDPNTNWQPNWYIAILMKNSKVAKKEVEPTGYTLNEIVKIEKAFEAADGDRRNLDEWIFNGLMNVVDVLAEIHCIDLEKKESAKLLFVK